jgi:hypothetical protein
LPAVAALESTAAVGLSGDEVAGSVATCCCRRVSSCCSAAWASLLASPVAPVLSSAWQQTDEGWQ